MNYEQYLERLNEYQKMAVYDDSKACLVNANVGSGKTTVLISKIIYLHYAKGVPYESMAVLTFTNKAADEIKERLQAIDDSVSSEQLNNFGTFHSVALSILKNCLAIESKGFTKDFLVVEPEEEIDLAMQLIEENKLVIKYKNRLKKRLEQARMIQDEERKISRYQDDIFTLVTLLKEEKIKQDKMSFTDLIEYANELLQRSDQKPDWIIVDEVQDCDSLQLSFLQQLRKEETSLFAVGDPNQVIYSWRGSECNVFYRLKETYQAKVLSLPINYRSSTTILEAAKCFLQNGGKLSGIRDQGSRIVVNKQYNSFNEACYLAEKIKRLHDEGTAYGDIAIFYRLQSQSKSFEDVFAKEGIPYEVSIKKTIKDIPVLNWLIFVMRYSANPGDQLAAVHALSNKEYGERLTVKKARATIKENQMFLSPLLDRMSGLNQFCGKEQKVSAEKLYEYFEFDSFIRPTSATYQDDKESILRLLTIIGNETEGRPFMEGLKEFLNTSALYGLPVVDRMVSQQKDAVKLMTLHASKGLEFSYVFITGVNYGLIPLQAKSFEDEEEERRLFFVGITRAKDYLELSYYTNPDFPRTMPGESRFLSMIPPHLLSRDGEELEEVNLHDLKKQIQKVKEAARKDEIQEEAV
ncbi:ATP-dependent DNA helicase UvrD/PcrA [Lachnospiraceae bacterium KM106-2]|nr:ATP-dependent DNA helicase UvrD/PcrA [Lachnospiraceae bacterium KM106-2]